MKSRYLQITRSNNNRLIVIQVLVLGHELEKELFPKVVASKLTGQNTKPKDDISISFNRINRHAIKVIDKSKKMM
jgi:hypothetical protein